MFTEEQIRELAYAIWEQEGRLEGKDQEYYFRAEKILKEREPLLSSAKESVHSSALQPISKPKSIERHISNRRPK